MTMATITTKVKIEWYQTNVVNMFVICLKLNRIEKRSRGLPVKEVDRDGYSEDHERENIQQSHEFEGRWIFRLSIQIKQRTRMKEDAVKLHEQSQHNDAEKHVSYQRY